MLSICVCGWYLEEYDDFYTSLHRLNKHYPVTVIANRNGEYLQTLNIPYVVRENTGLEWGAYNFFLMNIWSGETDVLFCHDDIELNPYVSDNEILQSELLIERIAKCGVDQAYIFNSRTEDAENYGQHGRMIYMSKAFLKSAKEDGGFYYDEKNEGYTTGEDEELKEKFGCFGYNAGILAFNEQAKRIGGNVHRKIYIPSFSLNKRGKRGSPVLEYGKWWDRVSSYIESADKKLHVGCGDNYWDTHTNVDLYHPKADIKADAKELPIEDESFDMVETHHLIEHMGKSDALDALKEWLRVLKPGGRVFMSCPDVTACFDLLKESQTPEVWDALITTIYGSDEPGMAHRYGYSRDSLRRALESAGFIDVEVKTAIGYRPTPALIAIGTRP